jgi:hypothetical protein
MRGFRLHCSANECHDFRSFLLASRADAGNNVLFVVYTDRSDARHIRRNGDLARFDETNPMIVDHYRFRSSAPSQPSRASVA